MGLRIFMVLILANLATGNARADEAPFFYLIDDTEFPRNLEFRHCCSLVEFAPGPDYERELIYREVGLQSNDVIKELDGRSLASDDLVLVSLKLRNPGKFKLLIERDGKEKTIHFQRPR